MEIKHLNESGLKGKSVALFKAGEAKEALESEAALARRGVAAMVMQDPDSTDLAALTLARGWMYGPTWIRWHRPAIPQSHWIDSTYPSQKKRGQKQRKYKHMLRKARGGARFEVELLTEENFRPWVKIFEKEIVPRTGLNTLPGFLKKSPIDKKDFDMEIRFIPAYEKATGSLLGGDILFIPEERSVLIIGYSAFSATHKHLSASYGAYQESLSYAIKENIKTLSYGTDGNQYHREDGSLGLLKFKSRLGLLPAHDYMEYSTDRSLKVLDPSAFGDEFVRFVYRDPTTKMNRDGYLNVDAVTVGPVQESILPWCSRVKRIK